MVGNDAPRKTIGDAKEARGGSRRKRLAPGKLKGKLLSAGTRPASVKASVGVARRLAGSVEQKVERGRELPKMRQIADDGQAAGPRSLWLRLKVKGKAITVLDAEPVDVDADRPDELRGTAFLEVRLGNELLAARALVDPGIAVGIPDYRSGEPFRGHRIMEMASYETFIRVDLERLMTLVERSERLASPELEINLLRTDAHVGVTLDRSSPPLSADRRIAARTASSARVTISDLLGTGRGNKPPPAKRPSTSR